jgi:hypothetical protein
MAQTRDVQIRIKIEDGQAFVQIDRLGKGFIRATSAAEEFKKAVARQDPVLKGSVADFQRQIRALKTVRDNSAKTSAEFLKQTKAIAALQQKQRALTQDVTEFTKVNENQISSAGLAGATLVEFGRTISDLPFGINAITNNLSQLATLFITLTVKTGGTTRAFALLGKQLKGPLGIILVLQAVIAGVQQLFGKTSKATEAVAEFTSNVSKQKTILMVAATALKNFTFEGEDARRVVKALNDNFQDLNLEVTEFGDITQESVESLDELIKVEAKRALTKQVLSDLIELEKQRLSVQQEFEESQKEPGGAIVTFLNNYDKFVKRNRIAVGSFLGLISEADKARMKIEEVNAAIEKTTRKVSPTDLANLIIEQLKLVEEGTRQRSKMFRESDLDFEKEILSSEQRILKIYTKTKEEQLKLEIESLEARAKLKQKEFEEDQNRRLRDFLSSTATEKEKQNARERANNSIKESRENLNKFLTQLDEEELKRSFEMQFDRSVAFRETLEKFGIDRMFAQAKITKEITDSEIDAIEFTQQAEKAKFDQELQNLETLRETELANGRSTIELDQKIVDLEAKHTETKIILAKKEAAAKLAIANQVGNAVIQIAGEGTVVGKAVAVAMATMNTREAFTAALGMKPYSVFNIAQAGAVLAAGFAQVREILKTKIPGKGGSGAGGSTGPTTLEAPDFNIVGASAQSQLAQTIAGAEAQPVRAFVVGKDITTQQELDRNVTRTASFG